MGEVGGEDDETGGGVGGGGMRGILCLIGMIALLARPLGAPLRLLAEVKSRG